MCKAPNRGHFKACINIIHSRNRHKKLRNHEINRILSGNGASTLDTDRNDALVSTLVLLFC